METEEIMVTGEDIEAEEFADAGLGKGVKIAVGVGFLAGLVGYLGYKFVGKPLWAKIKAKRAAKKADSNEDDIFNGLDLEKDAEDFDMK
ncbi:MAG: hypothetical protein RR475_02490 [Clostridia bacterium]